MKPITLPLLRTPATANGAQADVCTDDPLRELIANEIQVARALLDLANNLLSGSEADAVMRQSRRTLETARRHAQELRDPARGFVLTQIDQIQAELPTSQVDENR
jgi:hypothetical protein